MDLIAFNVMMKYLALTRKYLYLSQYKLQLSIFKTFRRYKCFLITLFEQTF